MCAAVRLLVDPLDVDDADRVHVLGDQVGLRPDQVGIRQRLGAREEQHCDRVRLCECSVQPLLDLPTEVLADVVELEVHPCGAAGLHIATGHLRAEVCVDDAGQRVERGMGPHDRPAAIRLDLDADGRALGGRSPTPPRAAWISSLDLAVEERVYDRESPVVGDQDARVTGLTTAAGVRDGAIEHDAERCHGDDAARSSRYASVAVEPLGHRGSPGVRAR